METLSKLFCTGVSFKILEYLIDFDYTPFRLRDVIALRSKISDWNYSVKWAHNNGRIDLFLYFMLEAPVNMITFLYTIHEKVPNKMFPLKPRYAQMRTTTSIIDIDSFLLPRGCVGSCITNAGLLGILTTEDLNVACLTNYEIYLSVAFFALGVRPYHTSYSPISYNKKESYRKNTIVVFESVYNNLWNRFLMLSCIVPHLKLLCVKYAIDRGASNSSQCLRKLLNSLNKNPTTCSLDHIEIIEYLLTETGKHKTRLMIDCVRTVKYLTIVCQANYSRCSGLILRFQSIADRISERVEPYYNSLCRTISHNCLLERTVVMLNDETHQN